MDIIYKIENSNDFEIENKIILAEDTYQLLKKIIALEIKEKNQRVYYKWVINEAIQNIAIDDYANIKENREINGCHELKLIWRGKNIDKIKSIINKEKFNKIDTIIYYALKEYERYFTYKNRYNLFLNTKDKLIDITIHDAKDTIEQAMILSSYLPLIYSVRITNNENKKSAILYVGQSLIGADRFVTHICNVFDDPHYFGLNTKQIKNNKFKLTIKIERIVNINKCNNFKQIKHCLNELEKKYCEDLIPFTQNRGLKQIKNHYEKTQEKLLEFEIISKEDMDEDLIKKEDKK